MLPVLLSPRLAGALGRAGLAGKIKLVRGNAGPTNLYVNCARLHPSPPEVLDREGYPWVTLS